MAQADDDNHSKLDDSNQYDDEWHTDDSLTFLSRFGDNDPDNSPDFPPPNGASTRVTAFMMDDMGTILMDDYYTPHPAISTLAPCQDRSGENHARSHGTTTSPIKDSFYDESYVQGKRNSPDLRDVSRFFNPSDRPAPTYSDLLTAELTTLSAIDTHENRIYQAGFTPGAIRDGIRTLQTT
jgi:hypothetical protein